MQEDTRIRLIGWHPDQMRALPVLEDEPNFRLRQIAAWIYRRGATEFAVMTDLPAALRKELSRRYSLDLLPVARDLRSCDGSTRKLLFSLVDGLAIEAVQMHEPRRDTVCVSTQVGCAYRCRFCATGRMGLKRNLTAHEILSQVLVVRDGRRAAGSPGHFNLVFMGMGEPLANYEAVTAAIRVLGDDYGLGIGRRRITVSTVGLAPQIRRLAGEPFAPRLALSLNATRDQTRSHLMPVNRRYPIREVLAALAEYRARTGQRTTLEYVLLAGINDAPEDARRLSRFARDCDCTVNLIVFNDHRGNALRGSGPASAEAFRGAMLPHAPTVTLRQSKGQDIQAACGQLCIEARPTGSEE
ncbi:MAG: 23S rRNA (adenine(2503)-C(2))-methyltransferase RlmN [Candidatus Eisenbacteria bacterium]|nr:23S rRNA (adenine(2503)-C(2))-methyltransferase RlmN [Candidatus Eisenbacteria bacterium]